MWEAIAAIAGGLLSKMGQDSANRSNVELNQENRDWMERMSSTSYQRGVKDMAAAGLNPLLAYSQGGASTPTSAAPVVQNSLGAGVGAAVSSAGQAIQVSQAKQQIEQSKAQQAQIEAQTDKIRSETMEQSMNSAEQAARIQRDQSSSAAAKASAANTNEQILGTRYESQRRQMSYRAEMGDEALHNSAFGADVRKRKAEAALSELGIAEAKAGSDFYESGLGHTSPVIRTLLGILRGVSSARGAMR